MERRQKTEARGQKSEVGGKQVVDDGLYRGGNDSKFVVTELVGGIIG